MCVTIACAAAGEADRHELWPWWVHLLLAFATLAVNVRVHLIQFRNIRLNGGILDAVMAEVEQRRQQEGLPSNEEALRQ
jgi:hypothetical protein